MSTDTEVLIVGAGFSGLGAAIALLEDGLSDFVVIERAASLGGTWRDNSYPGCACDIPSVLYSYSEEQNPDWTRAFAVVNYENAVVPFVQTSRLSESERAMLMGGACIKAYRWSPKKG